MRQVRRELYSHKIKKIGPEQYLAHRLWQCYKKDRPLLYDSGLLRTGRLSSNLLEEFLQFLINKLVNLL